MSAPDKKVQKIQTGSEDVYDIVPTMVTDEAGTYKATLPTLTKDEVIALKSDIDALPDPMIFRGSLGQGGTISALPVDGSATVGDTYKVITDGTYAGQSAHVGDTFVCDSKTSSSNTWVLFPSGDEPSGTVTSVGISVPTGLTVSNSPITSSGTIEIDYDEGYSIPTTSKQSEWDGKQDALPTYTTGKENYVLSVDASGNLVWKAPYNGAASGS